MDFGGLGAILVASCEHEVSGISGVLSVNQPAPGVQAPERLISTPEELAEGRLSYAEMAIFNAQGLVVNPQVAVLMAEVALELVSGYLKQFAVCLTRQAGAYPRSTRPQRL